MALTLESALARIEDREDRLRFLADYAKGFRYDSEEARLVLDRVDWRDYWPTVDSNGNLDGGIVDNEDGYYNVDDLAMVSDDNLPDAVIRQIARQEEKGIFDGYVHLSRDGKWSV